MKNEPTEMSVSDELLSIRPLAHPTLEQDLEALRESRPATRKELESGYYIKKPPAVEIAKNWFWFVLGGSLALILFGFKNLFRLALLLILVWQILADFSSRQFFWLAADIVIFPLGIARGIWHVVF